MLLFTLNISFNSASAVSNLRCGLSCGPTAISIEAGVWSAPTAIREYIYSSNIHAADEDTVDIFANNPLAFDLRVSFQTKLERKHLSQYSHPSVSSYQPLFRPRTYLRRRSTYSHTKATKIKSSAHARLAASLRTRHAARQ